MGWIAMATDQTSQSGHVCSIFVSFLFSDWRIWIEKREKREDFFSSFLESGQPSFFLILKKISALTGRVHFFLETFRAHSGILRVKFQYFILGLSVILLCSKDAWLSKQ